MGLAGWSTTEPTVKADLTLLPRGCEWSSDPNGIISEIILNVTTGGKRYPNLMFDRELMEFNFHFPQSENTQFKAMYLVSRVSDIWYVPDSDDMATKFNVRLEDKDYLPKNTGAPGQESDTMEMWFRWTYRISTETTEVEIED